MILPENNQAPLDAKGAQHLRNRLHQILIVYAKKEHLRLCRVRQGAQNVEHRTEAQLLADRSHVLHRGMILLCKHEAKARLLQHLPAKLGILLNVDAECLQAIRCTGKRRSCAVSVFCHLYAACCHNHCCCRGNIEGMRTVSAGSDNFQNLHPGMLHRSCQRTHRTGTARNLIDGLSLGRFCRQRRKEGRVLRRSGFPAHDLQHGFLRLVIGEIFLIHNLDNGFLNHDLSPPCFRSVCFLSLTALGSLREFLHRPAS